MPGDPMSGAPPYDQSEFGNGGEFRGDGNPRRGGAGPLAAVPFQSFAKARASLFTNPPCGAADLSTTDLRANIRELRTNKKRARSLPDPKFTLLS